MKKQLLYLPLLLCSTINLAMLEIPADPFDSKNNMPEPETEEAHMLKLQLKADGLVVKTAQDYAADIEKRLADLNRLSPLTLAQAHEKIDTKKEIESHKESDAASDSNKELIRFYTTLLNATDELAVPIVEGNRYLKKFLKNISNDEEKHKAELALEKLPENSEDLILRSNTLNALLLLPIPAEASNFEYKESSAFMRLKNAIKWSNDLLEPFKKTAAYQKINNNLAHPAGRYLMNCRSIEDVIARL